MARKKLTSEKKPKDASSVLKKKLHHTKKTNVDRRMMLRLNRGWRFMSLLFKVLQFVRLWNFLDTLNAWLLVCGRELKKSWRYAQWNLNQRRMLVRVRSLWQKSKNLPGDSNKQASYRGQHSSLVYIQLSLSSWLIQIFWTNEKLKKVYFYQTPERRRRMRRRMRCVDSNDACVDGCLAMRRSGLHFFCFIQIVLVMLGKYKNRKISYHKKIP